MKILIVIDMQNDFIDGALGTVEAEDIVDGVIAEIKSWNGPVICTRDTHTDDYLMTQEGRKLPVVHCIKGTHGWQINDGVAEAARGKSAVFLDKRSFGSNELPDTVRKIAGEHGENADDIEGIELIGICTDICVISNAMILKAAFPEVPICVNAACCAGVTPEAHDNALSSMAACQVDII